MTTLTIPNVDDELEQRLRARAAVHGRSLEAEARTILADAVDFAGYSFAPDNMAEAIRAIIKGSGGIDLESFPCDAAHEPPSLY